MHSEAVDWTIRVLATLGLPAIIMFWLRDRRRVNAQADIEERSITYSVRTNAATTLDTEVAALQRAMDVDRSVRDRTIKDLRTEMEQAKKDIRELRRELEQARAEIYRKDLKLAHLEKQVEQFTNGGPVVP